MSIADLSIADLRVFLVLLAMYLYYKTDLEFISMTLNFASQRYPIAECSSSTSFSQPVVPLLKNKQQKKKIKALLYDTWQILTVFYHHVNHMERGPTECKEKHHHHHHNNCLLLPPEIASRHSILNHYELTGSYMCLQVRPVNMF